MAYWKDVKDVEVYYPPGHTGTFNKRLVGPVEGIKGAEVIVGEMEPGGHADPHKHTDLEQVMYILEGKMLIEMDGKQTELSKDQVVWIPKGVNHEVKNAGDSNLRFLLIYTPPKN
ncbi:cupin domain-containing protein [Scopulibacillus cellulosilyticus]|uniref:Cupin domain-containing protein n=1 Tax=Scopulibacillus cellulosilyticus TaxID=2665665 RepID=A0ABW2PXR1_9BACL